ncbi:MAG: hypothetical protein H0U92_06925 [Actinobacteria bacterium]|nr:hypothetical protein [Actinomycetota bacterium]
MSGILAGEPFGRQRLDQMYRVASERGYRSAIFGEEDTSVTPWILWRHDVDLELAAVRPMAELEAGLGVRSTYFFMTASWFYNLLSQEGRSTVRHVLDHGHAVGLHCDLAIARDGSLADADIVRRVERDFDLLETAYPRMFQRLVSFHNPADAVLQREFESFYSTYQPKFFSDVKYLSDSNRVWREGPPEQWFDPRRHPRISILLHPELWAYPGADMPEGMRGYLAERETKTRAMLEHDQIPLSPTAPAAER